MCVCELREWNDRGEGDAEVRLRETGCLGEQPQSDCVMLGLISTGVVALRDFQGLFIRQLVFQEWRWEILV